MGLTKYERMRREYGEGSVAMIHHIRNKSTNYFFRTEMTMLTMDEFISNLGRADNYQPIRTYYIPLKENREEWEVAQYAFAQMYEPQKDNVLKRIEKGY